MDGNLGAFENSHQLFAEVAETGEKGVKLWLWGEKEAKPDMGIRSSSSVKLVAHLGGMLRAHLERILTAHLGRMPTCSAQGVGAVHSQDVHPPGTLFFLFPETCTLTAFQMFPRSNVPI